MATITASLFTALDGVVDPAVGNWHFPYFNEQMGEAVLMRQLTAPRPCASAVTSPQR